MNEIGERIRKIRIRRGLSCRELSDLTGYSRESIEKWELGTRKLHADGLAAICKALDVSSDYLLGIDGIAYTPGSRDIDIVLSLIDDCSQCLEQAKKTIKGE